MGIKTDINSEKTIYPSGGDVEMALPSDMEEVKSNPDQSFGPPPAVIRVPRCTEGAVSVSQSSERHPLE